MSTSVDVKRMSEICSLICLFILVSLPGFRGMSLDRDGNLVPDFGAMNSRGPDGDFIGAGMSPNFPGRPTGVNMLALNGRSGVPNRPAHLPPERSPDRSPDGDFRVSGQQLHPDSDGLRGRFGMFRDHDPLPDMMKQGNLATTPFLATSPFGKPRQPTDSFPRMIGKLVMKQLLKPLGLSKK